MRDLAPRAAFDMLAEARARLGLESEVALGTDVAAEHLKSQDGRYAYPEQVSYFDPEYFKFDVENRLRVMVEGQAEGRLLPSRKFLVYTYGSLTDPYGLGLGNRLYWPVWFKRKSMAFWLRFLDKWSGPTVVGKLPADAAGDTEERDALLATAAAAQSDKAVVIYEEQDLELLQAIQTAAQQGFDQIAKFLDGQIAQTVLGVTLTTEISGEGSRAATREHGDKEMYVGKADALRGCSFLNRTLCRWLRDFNARREASRPPIIVKRFPDFDMLKLLAGIDTQIFQTGYRRKLESVDKTYGYGEGVYEKAPEKKTEPTDPPEATGAEGGEKSGEVRREEEEAGQED